ncbi:MAG: DegT/DnrJ/EryC1/StrS family aminotransferase [candidate division Zixibacteria bacterium]|nr:DegT/DnrJ/EryC1/StrS family aminotransferase [candidate division Zixibacteria bacterium]
MGTRKIPITRPTLPDSGRIRSRVEEILRSGQLTNGKYVKRFENSFARLFGIKYTVALSSCTDGLTWVLKYLPPGEVILPCFTFSATGHAVVLAGHRPVFADCDRSTFNLDPAAAEEKITENTRAILATYIYGNPPDITTLRQIARRHRLKLVFDAAHAVGAKHRGIYAGNFGWAEVFSLTPTKQLCCGEGGMVATADKRLVNYLRLARDYGNPGNYNTRFVGSNIRMEEFNAILGLEGLKHIREFVRNRNRLAQVYMSELGDIKGLSFPEVAKYDLCAYKDFTILVNSKQAPCNRNQLQQALDKKNIESRRYFDPPLHRHKAYIDLGYGGRDGLENSDYISRNCLSLPMYSHLLPSDVRRIAHIIRREFSPG